MNIEKALFYFTHHSESIIQWLFLAILLLAMILVSRSLFAKKKAAGGADLSHADVPADLQSFLQTILERTSKLEAVPVHGMDKAGLASLESQVQSLKKDLAAREAELASVGKAPTAGASSSGAATAVLASGSPAGEELEKLNTRIKELEAKLSEYEILEDDIADLSLYKDENARMRTELEKLRGGEAAPVSQPTPQAEKIMDEFAQAVETKASESPGEPLKVEATGDNLADFENTLNLAKKMSAEPSPAPAAGVPEAEAKAESDDLFAEFTGEGEPSEGALDTSKVMDELTALENLTADAGARESLSAEIDTEKMAAEASKLTKT